MRDIFTPALSAARRGGRSRAHGLPNWGPENPGDEYETDELTDLACDFITRHKDETFFFYLPYNAPHTPLRAKQEAARAERLLAEYKDWFAKTATLRQ